MNVADVDAEVQSLTLEEKIGQLLCPDWQWCSPEEWPAVLDAIPIGSLFFPDWKVEEIDRGGALARRKLRTPPMIACDMERGFGSGTVFPSAMACGAARAVDRMRERGESTAREARAHGVQWSFAPCIDIPYNHRNLELLTRAWGCGPEAIGGLVRPLIEGMQAGGLLGATAKHFPGTGVDDRDQHLCTAVNPLSKEEWDSTFGRSWREVIDAGVMSIMPGHISLPANEGLADQPAAALPATLSRRLLTDLLRGELGFDGVIVSDAGVMVGFASRVPRHEMAIRFFEAGGDVYLFPNLREDFRLLLEANRAGRLTTARIDQSVRRVLQMKRRLGVAERPLGPAVTDEERARHERLAAGLAADAVTILRNDGAIPARVGEGSKVLCVHVAPTTGREPHRVTGVEPFVSAMREAGATVDLAENPGHSRLLRGPGEYDLVVVLLQVNMHQMMGSARIVDGFAMNFWEAFWMGHRNVVFASLSSPYHLYEFPHLPNMVLTYDPRPQSQKALAEVITGRTEARGRCPVRLPKEAGPVLSSEGVS